MRDHPPLDVNFFQKISAHLRGRAELTRVIEHAERLSQPDLCSSTQPVSLEQYLGRLYFEMSTNPSSANVGAYYDLVRLYAAELLTTTNWMVGRRGSLLRLMRQELEGGRSLSIVTFNHDLLVENALDQLPGRLDHSFCVHHSYGLPDHSWCHDEATEEFDDDSCRGDGDISIFKMHGSVNWIYRTRNDTPPADIARPRRRRTLFVHSNKAIDPWDTTMTDELNGRREWSTWPLIVPPIYEKHGLIHGELQGVWARAAEALQSASRVIFFGWRCAIRSSSILTRWPTARCGRSSNHVR